MTEIIMHRADKPALFDSIDAAIVAGNSLRAVWLASLGQGVHCWRLTYGPGIVTYEVHLGSGVMVLLLMTWTLEGVQKVKLSPLTCQSETEQQATMAFIQAAISSN